MTLPFLVGGGEMGHLIRARDWSATPLGDVTTWSVPLRTAVHLMLNTNHPVFLFWGPEHTCLYNDAYSRSLGSEMHPAILGTPGLEAWRAIWPVIGPQIAQVMTGGGATWHENQLIPIMRNGRLEPIYWTYSYSPISDDDAPNGIGGVLVLVTETTQQVTRAQGLERDGARWRSLFVQAPAFMCVLDGPDHRFQFANARYLELVQHRDVVGRTVAEALPEAHVQGFTALLDTVYRTGEPYTGTGMPIHLTSDDGSARLHYLDFVYQPVRDDADRITGILSIGYDVTDRMRNAAALRESESRYRVLAERLPGGAVFVVDRALRYVTAAGEAVTASGMSPQDFIGRSLGEVLAPESVAVQEPHYRRALAGEAFEMEHEDHGRYFLTRGAPLRDASGEVTGVLAASYDITTRRVAEDRLRAATARLEGVMAAAEIGVWAWDVPRHALEQDRNLARLYSCAEGVALRPEDLYERVHPEDRAAVRAAFEQALVSGHFYLREYRVFTPERGIRWLAGRGKLLRDGQERPALLSGLVIDISDLKALEESLKASDRQKDEFLAILAHELRNPLAPIRNAARILASEPLRPDELDWCRGVIARQVQHMALLLDDLMDVSRITRNRLQLNRQRIVLSQVVHSAVEIAMPAITSRAHRLHLELPDESIAMEADAGRIAQVIANLLNNAAKYSDPGGDITVHAARVGAGVEVTVRDTGIGLALEDRERIFDMFAQVDGGGQRAQGGLGIGLALVKGLVELHGGAVRVESEGIGKGSAFSLVLPALAPEPDVPPDDPVLVLRDAGPRLRILIADDNVDAAESLAMLLRLHGHDTRVTHDGREAVDAYVAFRPHIALLDLGMPELSGYEVATRIRQLPEGGRVVLAALTGWGQEENKRRTRDAGFDMHFTKPVDVEELIAAVSAAAVA